MMEYRKKLQEIIVATIDRMSQGKFCIFLSGGIDSVLIAHVCKKLGKEFVCYTAALDDDNREPATDLLWARDAADAIGLELKEVSVKELEPIFKKVIDIIGDDDFIKVAVGAVGYVCAEAAAKDGCATVFTGLGSEEIYAGYNRHRKVYDAGGDVNEECKRGLAGVDERDTSRDVAILKHFGLEAACPFLDPAIVTYSLTIPAEFKINDTQSKVILREVARDLGVPDRFCDRKKKGAQYGSKFDRAMKALARAQGLKKREYAEWLAKKE